MKTTIFKNRNQAAISTFCWGIYMLLNGVSMIVDPNGALTSMGFNPTTEIWIRMVGLLVLVMGFFYVQIGRYNFVPFYTWKIIGHMGGILIMSSFYFQGLVSSSIFIICLTDAIAALWTAWGIYYDRKEARFSTTS